MGRHPQAAVRCLAGPGRLQLFANPQQPSWELPDAAGWTEETLQVVASNRGAIGFVEASKVDKRVRGVFQFDD